MSHRIQATKKQAPSTGTTFLADVVSPVVYDGVNPINIAVTLTPLASPGPVPPPTPTPTPTPGPGPAPPVWPSYTGVSQYVGTSNSGRVTVYVDPSLGPDGLQNAQDLVADGDRVCNLNDAFFNSMGGSVQVIVFALGGSTDGTGGADHNSCDYVTGGAIEVDASFGASPRVSALFEAELSECSMGGNLCGVSTGEALSRWCAMMTSDNALSDFASAPVWSIDGMPDFVDSTDPTDQNYDSIGCGMAFISWLLSLTYTLPQIAQAMVSLGDGGTLAQLYQKLSNNDPGLAWPSFTAAVNALPGGVNSDDPFGTVFASKPPSVRS